MTRIRVACVVVLLLVVRPLWAAPPASTQTSTSASTEQWGIYEIALLGPADGNPFADITLSAHFTSGDKALDADGFYDGGGIYRVRFMPPAPGSWHYETKSNRPELSAQTGDFICDKPAADNHGPVRVQNTFHFAHADGTRFVPVGTTCYGWMYAAPVMQEQTVATLKSSPFNKIRMCVFPTSDSSAGAPPLVAPFDRSSDGQWDLTRFNPQFYQNLEKRIGQLRDEGVEADLILFHPYDRTLGFNRMEPAADERYLRYTIARLSAFRNVWWSLANEFDLIRAKTDADWDKLFQIVQKQDPYDHLRSIHFSARMYDSSKPWVTHLSVQNGMAVADFGRAVWYRDISRKPVVFDEVRYEGNIDARWGQLTPQEMVLRCWMGAIAGEYVGHGESYKGPPGHAWLSVGGEMVGQSPPRLAFLRQILETAPHDVEPIDRFFQTHMGGTPGEYYLVYFGAETPTQWKFELGKEKMVDGLRFKVDVLDTWNMTATPVDGTFKTQRKSSYIFGSEGDRTIPLPGKPYMALRIVRVDNDQK